MSFPPVVIVRSANEKPIAGCSTGPALHMTSVKLKPEATFFEHPSHQFSADALLQPLT